MMVSCRWSYGDGNAHHNPLGPYLIGSAWLLEGLSHNRQSGFAFHDALVVQVMQDATIKAYGHKMIMGVSWSGEVKTLWAMYPPQDSVVHICVSCPIVSMVGYILEESVNKHATLHVT
jgi:hypothetical protein